MPIYSKKELEHEIGQLLWDNGFLSNVEVEEQYIDGCIGTVTLKVKVILNGWVEDQEVRTEVI